MSEFRKRSQKDSDKLYGVPYRQSMHSPKHPAAAHPPREKAPPVVEMYGVPVYSHTLERAISETQSSSRSSDDLPIDFNHLKQSIDKDNMVSIPLEDMTTGEHKTAQVVWESTSEERHIRRMGAGQRWYIFVVLVVTSFQIYCLSTVWSEANTDIMAKYNVSHEVAILGVSLFVAGIGVGSMLLSPLSEFYGRKPIFVTAMVLYCALQFPTVLGQNIQSLLIGRGLTGIAGGALISTVFGTISDLFYDKTLGTPMSFYTLLTFLGPLCGPVLSSFVTHHIGFQLVFRIMIIWTAVLLILVLLTVPETYGPILFVREMNAKSMSPAKKGFKKTMETILRPFALLLEPVIFILSFYTGVLLAIIYLTFVGFPVVFEDIYFFKPEFESLTYLGIAVGMAVGTMTQPLWSAVYKKLLKRGGIDYQAEFWLPQVFTGSLFTSAGIFVFAWTNYNYIHWIIPIVGIGMFGFGNLLVLSGVFSYLIDGYRAFSTSAMAANTFVRCALASVFPLFGKQLFQDVNIHWAPTIFAILCAFMIAIPTILMCCGKWLRLRSKHSTEMALKLNERISYF
ncbi:probable drug/proton antiporter Yhk8p [Trichomonascus vanleenenianus]|uniref:MFS transporter n=1 Tax=Trichomonascus vanleenenianus TaxID=2268995 RepID=UPI003ECA5661